MNTYFYNIKEKSNMTLTKKLGAEFIGTFWLILEDAVVLSLPLHFQM
jgi:hypothetical protein